ncbi:MAG: nickel pincer cofactor biosynthesis protein LarC [Candidatus Hinthialibacter antarcticus]|nr:nickel pincer cofactor biosynthesis protein LarC [Candidatus Hinthialibacter antarcticus]
MKTLYFDVFAGVSGDMCIGAFIDAGCPVDELRALLSQLELPGFDLQSETVRRGALSGTKAHVIVEEEHHVHRSLGDVLTIVDKIAWPGNVRQRIEDTFTALAKAEGKIHDKPYDQIHFHEVGSYDAILDISGALLALHILGVEACACSKVHVGEGLLTGTRHGTIPLPPPASADLLQGFELFSTGRNIEMVTPTGAALLKTLAGGSSPMPGMKIDAIGYGAGSRDPKDLPGLLRVFIGETAPGGADRVAVIEANIDDMNPEFFEPLFESLFKQGALDVALSPVQMKKNRPGVTISVIAPIPNKEAIAHVLLRESSSIGVRMHECERRTLERKTCVVETQWGPVKGKVCWGHGVEPRFSPEYDSAKQIHDEHDIPMSRIYQEAARVYGAKSTSKDD